MGAAVHATPVAGMRVATGRDAPAVRGAADVRVGVRVRMGDLWVDAVTVDGALTRVAALVERGGGAVFTPNVDHVVTADRNAEFRAAYARADLSLADGAPVVWASRLVGRRLPAKVSGSDFVWPLVRLAAARGWRVYLLGGLPGAAAEAARRFEAECGVTIAGVDDAVVRLDDPISYAPVVARIAAARPHLVLVALGSPKQELLIDRVRAAVAPAVCLGVGASLDFVAGLVRRAPPWVSRIGLEWMYRLAQEPRRLWRRYLVDDPHFAALLLRTLRLPRGERVMEAGSEPA